MTDPKDILIETLEEETGFPVYQQGSLSDADAYPESFFTFWNDDSDFASYYDNANTRTIWYIDLNFYSVDVSLVNSIFKTIKPALEAAGFVIDGVGHDVVSDEDTHTGRGETLMYLQ